MFALAKIVLTTLGGAAILRFFGIGGESESAARDAATENPALKKPVSVIKLIGGGLAVLGGLFFIFKVIQEGGKALKAIKGG